MDLAINLKNLIVLLAFNYQIYLHILYVIVGIRFYKKKTGIQMLYIKTLRRTDLELFYIRFDLLSDKNYNTFMTYKIAVFLKIMGL